MVCRAAGWKSTCMSSISSSLPTISAPAWRAASASGPSANTQSLVRRPVLCGRVAAPLTACMPLVSGIIKVQDILGTAAGIRWSGLAWSRCQSEVHRHRAGRHAGRTSGQTRELTWSPLRGSVPRAYRTSTVSSKRFFLPCESSVQAQHLLGAKDRDCSAVGGCPGCCDC